MEKNLDSILDTIKTVFGFDIVRRLFFLGGIAASVVLGINLYQWIQDPLYRPLFSGMTSTNLSATVDTLEKARIPYRIDEATNSLSVPAKDVAVARMKLAAAGVSNDDGFNFSFLNDQGKLGSNPFLENARYIRALESDLAKTISNIQGISAAKVHIAIPKQNVYSDESAKTTASIILNITPGYEGDKEKIRAVIQLVAASVPDLDPSNVAITDQYGHYLSAINDQDLLLNQEQLNYQNTIQQYYEKRIQGLLGPMLGMHKTRVSVNADIDFSQLEEAKELFDPAGSVVRSEENVNESNSSAGASGVPGSLSNQPPANGGANTAQPSSGQSRNESIKNYEVSKTMHYSRVAAPKLKKLTVAVVLDDELVMDEKTKKMVRKPLDKEKMDQITELVQSAIGFSAERGDRVTVINSGFQEVAPIKETPTPLWEQPWFWDLVKRVGGILAGFVLLAIIGRKMLQVLKPAPKENAGTSLAAGGQGAMITPEMFELKNEQIKILRELAAQDPNKVASVIKRWITK